MEASKNGRPREFFTWNQFTDPYTPDGKKTPVVQCTHCKGQPCAAKLVRLRTHLGRCDKFRRSTEMSEYTRFMTTNNFATEENLIKLYGPGYAISAEGVKFSSNVYGPCSTSERSQTTVSGTPATEKSHKDVVDEDGVSTEMGARTSCLVRRKREHHFFLDSFRQFKPSLGLSDSF